jgi:hypothetical protein
MRSNKKYSAINLEELLSDTGRLTALHAADVSMQRTEIIPELIKLAFADNYPLSLRAANTIEKIDSQEPDLIQPYYKKIIHDLPSFKVDGVRRCLLKIFTRHTNLNDEMLLCTLLNNCFAFMASPEEPIAVKAYSLDILYQISKKIPELKNELIFAILDQLDKNSSAFKNFGNKILKKLYKETVNKNL